MTNVEPVNPPSLGESGTAPAQTPVVVNTEPQESKIEAPSEPSKEEPQGKEFTDLKTVPSELQPIAKKMQAEYTKRMQSIAEKERGLQTEMEPDVLESPQPTPTDEEIKYFMQTPQGQSLANYFDQRYGDIRQEVTAQKADKEVDGVLAKYGQDAIKANYDQINEVWKENPGVPLDMVVGSVMYSQAKEEGKKEFRQKLEEKRNKSLNLGSSSPMVTSEKPAKNWDEAVNQAFKKHNF